MQPFRTILFATDLSDSSNEAFRVASSLANENQTRLIVLHVVEPTLVADEPAYFSQLGVEFHRGLPDESHLEAIKRKLREFYTATDCDGHARADRTRPTLDGKRR
jgi:nucleotide-binding universal stress UspA family protein